MKFMSIIMLEQELDYESIKILFTYSYNNVMG